MTPPRLPVFVYGTLRPGEKNYPLFLEGKTVREAPATVCGELYFVADGGYPYLIPGESTVTGELVELDPDRYGEILHGLDRLEEYDPADEERSVYLRRKATVTLRGGGETPAWVYWWNCPGIVGKRIAGGDFKRRSEG